MGDYGRAAEDYDKAIELDPKLAVAYFNRGENWLRVGDWEKAQVDLSIAHDLGAAVAPTFSRDHASVAAFERKYGVKLPAHVANMLTDQNY